MREIVKRTLVLTAATAAIAIISGCASTIPMGCLYTSVKLPVSGAGDKGTKVGTDSLNLNILAAGTAAGANGFTRYCLCQLATWICYAK